jgi:putative FmdB family regulatory protein
MPTYTYRCLDDACYEVQDVFHPMSQNPEVLCIVCGGACRRIILETPHMVSTIDISLQARRINGQRQHAE